MLDAAKAMKLSAKDLFELKVIDEIIDEPTGGAHRDKDLMVSNIRTSILNNLETVLLLPMPLENLPSKEII